MSPGNSDGGVGTILVNVQGKRELAALGDRPGVLQGEALEQVFGHHTPCLILSRPLADAAPLTVEFHAGHGGKLVPGEVDRQTPLAECRVRLSPACRGVTVVVLSAGHVVVGRASVLTVNRAGWQVRPDRPLSAEKVLGVMHDTATGAGKLLGFFHASGAGEPHLSVGHGSHGRHGGTDRLSG